MTKIELINKISKETGLHKTEVRLFLAALFNVIIENVANRDRVSLGVLGTFSTRERHGGYSAKGRHTEYRLPKFVPTQSFMDIVDPIQYGDYTIPPEHPPIYRY